MVQPSSEIRQHAVQTACVLGADVVRLPEVALPLGRLLGEDVAAVGVARLVLAGSGLPEALGRAPMRLDLGHCDVLGVVSSTGPGGADRRHAFHPAWPVCKPLVPKEPGAGPKASRPVPGRTGPAIMPAAGFGRNRCAFADSPRLRGGPGPERGAGRGGAPEKRSAPGGALSILPTPARGGGEGRYAGRARGYFFLGAIIITICRPSRRGRDSITMSSPRSASMRAAISRPSSWWLISRPRKRMLTLILSPSSRKPRILRSLIWWSPSSVTGRNFTSLISSCLDFFLASLARFCCSNLNFPKSMILQTGGSALGWIYTRSRPSPSAICSASSRDSTPTISPSEPITRTRGTRISLLRRFCLSWVLIRGLRKWGYRGRHRAPAVRDGTDF